MRRKTVEWFRSGCLLAFEPGEHWLYGFSSELAAGIVEAVCSKAIEEQLKEFSNGYNASFVYVHDLIPSKEEYYHPRIRAAAYGLLR